MNTTVRYMRMALFAVIVIVVMAAISAVLEIGIINAGQAQEQEQSLFVSLLIPFFAPPALPPSSPSTPDSLNITISPELKSNMW